MYQGKERRKELGGEDRSADVGRPGRRQPLREQRQIEYGSRFQQRNPYLRGRVSAEDSAEANQITDNLNAVSSHKFLRDGETEILPKVR